MCVHTDYATTNSQRHANVLMFDLCMRNKRHGVAQMSQSALSLKRCTLKRSDDSHKIASWELLLCYPPAAWLQLVMVYQYSIGSFNHAQCCKCCNTRKLWKKIPWIFYEYVLINATFSYNIIALHFLAIPTQRTDERIVILFARCVLAVRHCANRNRRYAKSESKKHTYAYTLQSHQGILKYIEGEYVANIWYNNCSLCPLNG